jgi:hypothetical protein
MQTFDLQGLAVTNDTLRECAWDARGDRLAVCARGAAYVFSREAPTAPVRYDVGDATARCVAFSPDGSLVAVGTDRGARAVLVFDAATAAVVSGSATVYSAEDGETFDRMADLVTDLAFSPDGGSLAVAGEGARGVLRGADGWSGGVARHDADGSSRYFFETFSLAFSPDGRAVLWSEEFGYTRVPVAALGGAAYPRDVLDDRGSSDLAGPSDLGPTRAAGCFAVSADGRRTTLAMHRASDGRAVLVRLVGRRATAVVAKGDGAKERLDAVHVDDARGALWCTRKGALYRMSADTGELTRVRPCAGIDLRRSPIVVAVSGDGAVARVYRDTIAVTRIVTR